MSLFLLLSFPLCAEEATSTRSIAEGIMKRNLPCLHFTPNTMSTDSFPLWQADMRNTMATLMHHPEAQAKKPERISSEDFGNYRFERWHSYPIEGAVVPFTVIIPHGINASNPAPAVLCIPGSGQTMAGMTAEGGMARLYADEGLVAVAVENPAAGELADNGRFDYVESSRFLLEAGWSYLGLASWQDKVILDWMKTAPEILPNRIIVSGFSLGTEPMMALGLLDESIYAFVYNDFLCRTRERALTMNKPDDNGAKPYPNNIRHLIPGFLMQFDFPDIVAALAPRPVICTEGGMDRDFRLIKAAYKIAGAEENFTFRHYEKFADCESRVDIDEIPSGIDRNEFFRLANVDPPHHYFKWEHVKPWLKNVMCRQSSECKPCTSADQCSR